jgi:DNA-binding transcriptional regulator YhcF (GntR family)
MGGFNEGTPPAAAPEYPPENNIDIASSLRMGAQEAIRLGLLKPEGSLKTAHEPGWLEKELIASIKDGGDMLGLAFGAVAEGAEPILAALLKAILAAMEPAVNLGGDLAHVFVGSLVDHLTGRTTVTSSSMEPGEQGAVKGMFDGIMSPLMGLTAAADPSQPHSGEQNAQYTLGALVAVQLHTWIINIVSNLTGIGVLKFINSFDECITGSLNARALGRGAMKPYLEKFIATPLTNDLNVAMPLAIGSASQLIKRYLRGNITADDLKAALRKQGYDDEVVADQLLDAAKLLTVSQVVYLVKMGQWTVENAYTALQQAGYPLALAVAAYEIESNSRVDSQHDALADDLLTLYKDHRMDREAFVAALQSAGFTDAEVQAYSLRGAYAQEIPKRLTYTQVKSLYAESLVDLNYVTDFLTAEGYSNTDADLLVLHEFTKKEERDQAVKLLASIRRAQLEAGLKDQVAADAARKAALALLTP